MSDRYFLDDFVNGPIENPHFPNVSRYVRDEKENEAAMSMEELAKSMKVRQAALDRAIAAADLIFIDEIKAANEKHEEAREDALSYYKNGLNGIEPLTKETA